MSVSSVLLFRSSDSNCFSFDRSASRAALSCSVILATSALVLAEFFFAFRSAMSFFAISTSFSFRASSVSCIASRLRAELSSASVSPSLSLTAASSLLACTVSAACFFAASSSLRIWSFSVKRERTLVISSARDFFSEADVSSRAVLSLTSPLSCTCLISSKELSSSSRIANKRSLLRTFLSAAFARFVTEASALCMSFSLSPRRIAGNPSSERDESIVFRALQPVKSSRSKDFNVTKATGISCSLPLSWRSRFFKV
mmetsp:Transcript_32919/g.129219  ORF Transcript_32919/g.129219 Transcript_32919/m.129219 type:complete len:257 (-) Transcript_32919:726-1496(-)